MSAVTETASIDRNQPALARAADVLRERARIHCENSTTDNEVLAAAYRRRAAELNLAAWVGEVKAGAPPNPRSVSCVA